jgi:hypothetical protein
MKIEISQKQKEFFAGCMLGDGNIKIPSKCKNAMFQCQHGPEQIEYNKYKYNILSTLGAKFYEYERKTPNKITGKYYKANIVATNCNSNITYLYNLLYKEGKKKITNEILENFTAFSLAILFMDDGSKTRSNSKEGQITYTIASCGFDKESLELFQKFLFNKFNIETTITKDNRLYIRVNSRNLFEYLILPYVKEVPCMLYKLRDLSVS